MILVLLGFIGHCVYERTDILDWGRRSVVLLLLGLVICCFVAVRDGLNKTIQHAIDGSYASGLFPLVGVHIITGHLGALLILTVAIVRPLQRCSARARSGSTHHVRQRGAEDRDRGNCKDLCLTQTGKNHICAADEQGWKIYFWRVSDLSRWACAVSAAGHRIASEGKIYLFTGSKVTGGVCVTRQGFLPTSKLSQILTEIPALLN